MFNIPGLVWKSLNSERRLVLRWKKRKNGELKKIRVIYIGNIDKLADMIENPMKVMHVISMDFGSTAFVKIVDLKVGLKHIVDKVMGLGYDFSNIFIDASNMYTFMEENDMAKKGHNKKHRYDLNQISYYIAANYDYIPLYGESYAGNMHDSKTFESIINNIPDNSILIFDRGYNSKSNIDLIGDRRYIGALKQSDHHDIMKLEVGKDSHIELMRNVYGKDHRIILYHSSSLEKRKTEMFMNRMGKVILRVKKIINSGNSDAMDKARIYQESENLMKQYCFHPLQ